VSGSLHHEFKTGRFWRHFAVHAFSAVGVFAAALGLLGLFFPRAVSDVVWLWVAVVVVVSTVYGGRRSWPQRIEQSYESPNMRIRIVKGSLFEQPGHLVIGMCDTFDTSVPNIIERNSVQGQFLSQVFDDDVAEMDRQLSAALIGHANPIGQIAKEGKTDQYPLGTVAVLRSNSRRFFCLAYTQMNDVNEARATVDGIWLSLERLWAAVSAHSNGGVIAMPVIGGGQSRIAQFLPAQDSIRLVVMSFMFASRREKLCSGLDICVPAGAYEKLDRLELQSFLRSLRPS
jgi:hypothetical protein